MIVTLTALFAAVCMVEGNTTCVHPDGASYGLAGVTKAALVDYNDGVPPAERYTLKDMDDPAKARRVFASYTTLVCVRNHWSRTNRNRLRAWHPKGDTEDYVDRVMRLASGEE